jgi:sugar phosphate isomerase/epimerase
MQRRRFLQTSLGMLCLSRIRAESQVQFSLGFSLYGMRSLKLTDAMKACKSIGYDAIELPVLVDWPGDPKVFTPIQRKDFRLQLNDLGLLCPALMENLPLDVTPEKHLAQQDRLKRACDLANEIVPGKPPIIETILGGKVGTWDELKNQFRDRLGDWAKIAEKAKIVMGIKPHRFGAMNLPQHATWLMQQLGSTSIRVVYDWSHYEGRGVEQQTTMKELIPKTVFVHVKDAKIQGDKAEFVLPGQGSTDYRQFFQNLRMNRYSGAVCVEVSAMLHSKKGYNPIEAAQQSYEKLKTAMRMQPSQ